MVARNSWQANIAMERLDKRRPMPCLLSSQHLSSPACGRLLEDLLIHAVRIQTNLVVIFDSSTPVHFPKFAAY